MHELIATCWRGGNVSTISLTRSTVNVHKLSIVLTGGDNGISSPSCRLPQSQRRYHSTSTISASTWRRAGSSQTPGSKVLPQLVTAPRAINQQSDASLEPL